MRVFFHWIVTCSLLLGASPGVCAQEKSPEGHVLEVVREQLEAIRDGQLEQAYTPLISQEFAHTMPYEQFASFVSQHGILGAFDTLYFSSPQVSQNLATVTAHMQQEAQEGSIPIHYTLVKEGDAWKILGFVLNQTSEGTDMQYLEEIYLVYPLASEFFEYLQAQNIEGAYQLTSHSFQKHTSLEDFATFLELHPFLLHHETFHVVEGFVEPDYAQMRLALFKDHERIPTELYFVKSHDEFTIQGIKVFVTPAIHQPLNTEEMTESIEEVESFFLALRQEEIATVYRQMTSEPFQRATSLQAFTSFIESHPLLIQYSSLEYVDAGLDGITKMIYVTLKSSEDQLHLALRIQPDQKISSLTVLEEHPDVFHEEAAYSQRLFVDKIELFLSLLAQGRDQRVYDATSASFQTASPYPQFQRFLNDHPILMKAPRLVLNEILADRDQVMVEVEMTQPDEDLVAIALFVFAYEGKEWKISRLEVKNGMENQLTDPDTASIEEMAHVVIGQQIDHQGAILEPEEVLSILDAPVFLNVLFPLDIPQTLSIQLTHEPSQSISEPSSFVIDSSENPLLVFQLHPPSNGWPPGSYLLSLSSSIHGEKRVEFKIQK